tara:strand:+ start:360 stop:1379 length:1020 start_codon:yes stop_codon:yes gene_type:complete
MSYLGKVQLKSSDIKRFDITGSTSATHVLGWKAPNEQSLIITINGVKQQDDAYSIAGSPTTVTLTDALIVTDKLEIVGIVDVGTMNVPGVGSVQTDQLADDAVATAKIQDDAVTADKLANSINTEITANTAKVTNATHTGDVTGATALTIAADAVDIAMLSATGTADATTFLRGDNAWAAAGGGKVLQVVQTVKSDTFSTTSDSYVDVTGLAATITPSSASNKIVVSVKLIPSNSATSFFFRLFRGTTEIGSGDAAVGKETCFTMGYSGGASTGQGYYGLMQRGIEYLDTPATTSATTYKIQGRSYSTSNTTYVNRSAYDAGEFDGRGISTVTLWEIEG